MKKIEMVITDRSLELFKNSAFQLGIAEFEVTEVYRSTCASLRGPRRLCDRYQSTSPLLPRLRVGFVLFDQDLGAVLNQLRELIRPENILVFRVEQEFGTISLANIHSGEPIAHTREGSSPLAASTPLARDRFNRAAPNGVGINRLGDLQIRSARSLAGARKHF